MKNQSLYMEASRTPVGKDEQTLDRGRAAKFNFGLGKTEGFIPTEYAKVNALVKASGARIFYGDTTIPFTDTAKWEIHFPYPQAFTSPEAYAYVILHELSHYAGQFDNDRYARMTRGWTLLDQIGGTDDMAVEELTAESMALRLAMEFGIEVKNIALEYLASFLKDLHTPEESWNLSQDRAERGYNKLVGMLP